MIEAHNDYILSIKFSLNTKYLVTSSADTTIKTFLINMDSTNLIPDKTLYGHFQWIWDVEILADSKHLLSISSDGFLKCWRLSDGTFIKDNTEKKRADSEAKRDIGKNLRFVAMALKS